MEVVYSNDIKSLKDSLLMMQNAVEVKSVMLLVSNDKDISKEQLSELVLSFPKPLIGGYFYELIFHSQRYATGVLIIPLTFTLETEVFHFERNAESVLKKLESKLLGNLPERGSVFIYADAFAASKNQFIGDLFNFFGYKFTFVGAGCGSDSFVSTQCIIHNSGIFENAGVIGLTSESIKLQVGHGWKPISKPMRVTESVNNKIITIDWESASDVYKKTVEEHSGLKITKSNFQDIAKSYPIGLIKIDSEMVIRDPYMAENGVVYCLDNVEKGQYISILHGNADSLISGAAMLSEDGFHDTDLIDYVFCIDCFSRVKFLGDNFQRELEAIGNNLLVNGALSFGEIANVGESFLEIYNKTIIVARWKQTF